MEPLKSRDGFFDRDAVFMLGETEVHFRASLPRKARTWLALDLAEAALVFDEDSGTVYESYTYELVLTILTMKYYTDLDLSPYEDEEGWYQIYDILESHGALDHLYAVIGEDLDKMLKVYRHIRGAATKTFEKRHSLDYLVQKSFGSLLGSEDIMTTMARAESVNSLMIKMMDAFRERNHSPSQMAKQGIIPFAKRNVKKEPPLS